jgi:hypothetical protein
MKTSILLLALALLCGCHEDKSRQTILMPITGQACTGVVRHEVTNTVGTLVVGDRHWTISNVGDQGRSFSVPLQDALLLLPGHTSTFRLETQPEQTVAPGASITFTDRFAWVIREKSTNRPRYQIVLMVDGVANMLEIRESR